jgi:hypothetical protein
LITNIIAAIPQPECDGMCSLNIDSHQCTEMIEMSCCDMMGMNSDDQFPDCDLEFAENSCDYKYESINTSTFIIPKTIDSKVELVQLSSIDINISSNIVNFIVYSQSTIADVSPPIYLTVSSFLI